MKNIIACCALLSTLSPLALQAMDVPQRLSKIEQRLVVREIESKGMQTILNQISAPGFQALIIRGKFERESNDPLIKEMFTEINSIEAQPRVSSAPRNYLGQETRYFFKPSNSPNCIQVIAKLSNVEDIRTICTSYNQ